MSPWDFREMRLDVLCWMIAAIDTTGMPLAGRHQLFCGAEHEVDGALGDDLTHGLPRLDEGDVEPRRPR